MISRTPLARIRAGLLCVLLWQLDLLLFGLLTCRRMKNRLSFVAAAGGGARKPLLSATPQMFGLLACSTSSDQHMLLDCLIPLQRCRNSININARYRVRRRFLRRCWRPPPCPSGLCPPSLLTALVTDLRVLMEVLQCRHVAVSFPATAVQAPSAGWVRERVGRCVLVSATGAGPRSARFPLRNTFVRFFLASCRPVVTPRLRSWTAKQTHVTLSLNSSRKHTLNVLRCDFNQYSILKMLACFPWMRMSVVSAYSHRDQSLQFVKGRRSRVFWRTAIRASHVCISVPLLAAAFVDATGNRFLRGSSRRTTCELSGLLADVA